MNVDQIRKNIAAMREEIKTKHKPEPEKEPDEPQQLIGEIINKARGRPNAEVRLTKADIEAAGIELTTEEAATYAMTGQYPLAKTQTPNGMEPTAADIAKKINI